VPLFADDDVVMDEKRLGRGHDLLGHLNIGPRGRGIARGVTMAVADSSSARLTTSRT